MGSLGVYEFGGKDEKEAGVKKAGADGRVSE